MIIAEKDRVIRRYTIPIVDFPIVNMSKHINILHLAMARDGSRTIDMWAMIDPLDEAMQIKLCVVQTGILMPKQASHFVGTVVNGNGEISWHVFLYADKP